MIQYETLLEKPIYIIMEIKYLFIIFILSFFVSCNSNSIDKNRILETTILLPDTISKKEAFYGEINYTSEFDTIKLKESERRDVFLYLNITKVPSSNYKEFLKTNYRTFVTLEDTINIIPIFDLEFKSSGNYYLDCYIIDQLWLENNKNVDGQIKVPTKELNFTHKILVLE